MARIIFHSRSLVFLRYPIAIMDSSPTSLNQLAYQMGRMSTHDCYSGCGGASFPSQRENLSLSAQIRAEAEHREFQECGQFDCLEFKMTPTIDSPSYTSTASISTASSLSRGSGMTRSHCVADLATFGASHYESSRPIESKSTFGPGPNGWGYYVDSKK